VAPDSSLQNDKIRDFMAVPICVCPDGRSFTPERYTLEPKFH
jgi:hypothetical protein